MSKKIAYVVTCHNKISNRGEIRVYYTDGRDRKYKAETLPRTVADFCVMAKHCEREECIDEVLNTYY